MKTSSATIFRQFLMLLLSGLLMSCGGGGGSADNTSSTSQYASVSISLGTNSTAKGSAGSTILPDDITRCVATCSGPGMTAISAELPLDGSALIMSNIPPGVNRLVTINAYNNQLLRMSGSITITRLTAGTRRSVSIRVADVAVMIISLNPIVDMATATDSTFVQITPSATLQLYAGVTNHVDDSVTWHVNGVAGGTAGAGTISTTGLYHAPATTGSFTIQTVSNEDSTLTDSITVAVVNAPANVPPIANAGADRTVLAGASVTLNGSASSDSDGTITGYHWVQTLGTTVTLSDADIATPLFMAPNVTSAETLTFALTVTDDDGATNSDTISIIIQPAGAEFHVSPKIIHVVNETSQQFTASAPADWYVEGVLGGDYTNGTIDDNNLYTAHGVTLTNNPHDITIEAIDTAANSDIAKVAAIIEDGSQKVLKYTGYTLDQYSTLDIYRYRYIWGSTFSHVIGNLQDSSSNHYLAIQEMIAQDRGDFVTYYDSATVYRMPNSWGQHSVTTIPTKSFDGSNHYGYLVATADSITPSSDLTQAISLVKLNRDRAIIWANQYELGTVDTHYGCPDNFYYFDHTAISDSYEYTSSNHLVGFSYYNLDCSGHYSTDVRFYVIDDNGTLQQNIRIVPAYNPPSGHNLSMLFVVSIKPVSDGGFLVAANARIDENGLPLHDPIVFKLHNDYSLEWIHQLSESIELKGMVAAANDEYYLFTDHEIIQLNSSGVIIARKNLSATNGDCHIINVYHNPVSDDILIMARWNDSNWSGEEDDHLALISTDSNFNIQWQNDYGIYGQDAGDISVWGDDSYYYLSGARHESNDSTSHPMLMQIPIGTGLIPGVSANYPVNPSFNIGNGIALSSTDITAGTIYEDNPVGGLTVKPFTPVLVISPTSTLEIRAGWLPTAAISKMPDVTKLLQGGAQIQFHATLSHLLTDSSVTWSVNGIDGGNFTVGTIDNAGLYTSPDSVPPSGTVIIRATSNEEPSLYKETSLTIDDAGGGS